MQLEKTENQAVCTSLTLSGFGEECSVDHDGSWEDAGPVAADLDGFKKSARTCVDNYCHDKDVKNKKYQYKIYHPGRMATVVAYTTQLQTFAEECLRQIGFTQNGPFKKLKDSRSELSIWIMPAPEFLSAIDWEDVYS